MASDNIVNAHLQQRRGTAAVWTTLNPVLGEGEIGYVTDAKTIRIGDGVTAWKNLPEFKAVNAGNADTLGGVAAANYLRTTGKAADSDKLDGYDSANAASANTIPVRDAAGQFMVGTPTDPSHAVNKSYADNKGAPPTTVTVFTASGSFTVPANAVAVEVICIGAGGGGAAYTSNNNGVTGGGGGARVRTVIPASALPSQVPITVGSGGPGGNSSSGNGINGGTSAFGTYVTACGGSGGSVNGLNVGGGLPAGYSGNTGGANGGVIIGSMNGPISTSNTYVTPEQGGIGYNAGSYTINGSSVYGGGAGGHAFYGSGYMSGGGYSGALAGGSTGGINPGGSRSGSGLAGSGGSGYSSGSGALGTVGAAGGIPGGGGGALNLWSIACNGGAGGRGEVVIITYV